MESKGRLFERLPETSDPWIANMGIFQDDPTFDDFLAEVNTYRNAFALAKPLVRVASRREEKRLPKENRSHRDPFTIRAGYRSNQHKPE